MGALSRWGTSRGIKYGQSNWLARIFREYRAESEDDDDY